MRNSVFKWNACGLCKHEKVHYKYMERSLEKERSHLQSKIGVSQPNMRNSIKRTNRCTSKKDKQLQKGVHLHTNFHANTVIVISRYIHTKSKYLDFQVIFNWISNFPKYTLPFLNMMSKDCLSSRLTISLHAVHIPTGGKVCPFFSLLFPFLI